MRSGPGAALPEDRRRQFQLLSDRPIEADSADRLGYGVSADALADLIDHQETETPLTVAITGPWGSGKTSMARLVEQRLTMVHSWSAPHLICRFNAWLHDDAPSVGLALASAVTRHVDRQRPLWRRMFQPVALSMISPRQRWHRQWLIGVLSVVAAVAVVLSARTRDVADTLAGGKGALKDLGEIARPGFVATTVLVALLFWAVASKLFTATTAVSRFLSSPQEEAAKGSMQAVHSELGKLIGQALGIRRRRRRLVIVVDDLDRCSGERALEICQVAAKLLSHPGVVTVLVGELDALGAAAAARLAPGTEPTDTPVDLQQGRVYLDKLIQVRMDLPALDAPEIQAMLLAGNPPHPVPPLSRTERTHQWLQELPSRLRQALRDLDREHLTKYAVLALLVGVTLLFLFPIVTSLSAPPDRSTGPAGTAVATNAVGPAIQDHAIRRLRPEVVQAAVPSAASPISVTETGELARAGGGDASAANLVDFFAPIAALLIGIVGVKFLFGEQRSLAGFIGFLVLAIAVFALIRHGSGMLDLLGCSFRSWFRGDGERCGGLGEVDFFRGIDFVVAAAGTLLTLAGGIRIRPGYGARRQGENVDAAIRRAARPGVPPEAVAAEAGSRFPWVSLEQMRLRLDRIMLEHPTMEQAQQELMRFLPNNPRAAKRTMTQLRITVVIAFGRGLLSDNSPLTAAHLAKWVAFNERWPMVADTLRRTPEQLAQWESSDLDAVIDLLNRVAPTQSASDFHDFLHTAPSLVPHLWQLQHLNRGTITAGPPAAREE
ncbi:P-loop NTPase fold protein [Streptomyces sp. AS02]|uniref:KAP family P-loop NTPase fold protein n=1 Tax=Streptomyces sp. AS02 TaxID=2938946 RepID=UPI0020224DC6|nr:P-loop NTPase fold protein [Streptomyces sp. AS02]MCL8015909.1 KAP family NTPase [Streptomyces sp. AS02]